MNAKKQEFPTVEAPWIGWYGMEDLTHLFPAYEHVANPVFLWDGEPRSVRITKVDGLGDVQPLLDSHSGPVFLYQVLRLMNPSKLLHYYNHGGLLASWFIERHCGPPRVGDIFVRHWAADFWETVMEQCLVLP
ncbi:MAG: hypothetical protein AB7L09_02235 [Nitrospira sp.]